MLYTFKIGLCALALSMLAGSCFAFDMNRDFDRALENNSTMYSIKMGMPTANMISILRENKDGWTSFKSDGKKYQSALADDGKVNTELRIVVKDGKVIAIHAYYIGQDKKQMRHIFSTLKNKLIGLYGNNPLEIVSGDKLSHNLTWKLNDLHRAYDLHSTDVHFDYNGKEVSMYSVSISLTRDDPMDIVYEYEGIGANVG